MSLCLNDVTNSRVYVAGCELAYRYCLQPGARYLLLPHYLPDNDGVPHTTTTTTSSSSNSSSLQFCVRVFAATDLNCR